MVVIDATMLMLLLRPDVAAPKDSDGNLIEKPKERLELLVKQLQNSGTKLVIPTPALSEILVRAGVDGSQAIVDHLNKYSVFSIAPFDTRAAIEVAAMIREAPSGNKKDGSASPWAKVKYDRQIVAIAKVAGAKTIYSDDGDVKAIARKVGIETVGIADLPLPEEDRQGRLALEMHKDGPSKKDDDQEQIEA